MIPKVFKGFHTKHLVRSITHVHCSSSNRSMFHFTRVVPTGWAFLQGNHRDILVRDTNSGEDGARRHSTGIVFHLSAAKKENCVHSTKEVIVFNSVYL